MEKHTFVPSKKLYLVRLNAQDWVLHWGLGEYDALDLWWEDSPLLEIRKLDTDTCLPVFMKDGTPNFSYDGHNNVDPPFKPNWKCDHDRCICEPITDEVTATELAVVQQNFDRANDELGREGCSGETTILDPATQDFL